MKEKKVVREERNKEKLTSGDWVMAEFYSIHSLKSSRMHAVIDEFKKLMGGKVEVVQVNVDEEKTLAEFYTIVHIPTYIFLRKGEQLWRQTGAFIRPAPYCREKTVPLPMDNPSRMEIRKTISV